MRRDSDGAGDLLAPVEVGEKMLAEALASHGMKLGNDEISKGGCKAGRDRLLPEIQCVTGVYPVGMALTRYRVE